MTNKYARYAGKTLHEILEMDVESLKADIKWAEGEIARLNDEATRPYNAVAQQRRSAFASNLQMGLNDAKTALPKLEAELEEAKSAEKAAQKKSS